MASAALLFLAALGVFLVLPSFAEAISVTYTRADADHDVTYQIAGGNGQNNDVAVSIVDGQSGGSQVIIEERGSAGLSVTDPLGLCSEVGKTTTCLTFLQPGHNNVSISADLGSGNDAYTGPAGRFAWAEEGQVVVGGDHDDTLKATNWAAWLIGGNGDDVLDTRNGGSPAANSILGGQGGFDILRAKNGQIETAIDCGGQGRASVDAGLESAVNCSAGTGDAPSVSIDDGPGAGSGALLNTMSADFEFSSEPGATFECRQYVASDTPPAWAACSSPKSYGGLTGNPPVTYKFDVRAKDILGITGSATSYTWTVDTEPPSTDFFPFGGVHVTTDPTPELPEFGSPDPDTDHYECQADGAGTWHVCTSGGQWQGPPLSDGPHTIAVRAVDNANNPDPDPKEQEYLIDTKAPEVAFADSQSGDAASIKATFVETGSGFDSGEIAARLRDTGNPWSGLPTTRSGNTLTGDLSKLSPGLYEFRAQVRDQAGNVGESTKAADGTTIVLRVSRVGTTLSAGFDGVNGNRELVPYQSGGKVIGTLRTTSGAPVTGQPVSVKLGRYPGSGELATPRTQRTNGNGQVAWQLPPGPSRTVTLKYAGAGRLGASTSQELDHAVEGHVELKRKKKRVRAGRKLKLKGTVGTDGALMPANGLLVEVQVKGGGIHRWRTVKGAVRTKPDGGFKLKEQLWKGYVRKTKFKFRAELLANDLWPYVLPVKSKVNKVKVIPRKR